MALSGARRASRRAFLARALTLGSGTALALLAACRPGERRDSTGASPTRQEGAAQTTASALPSMVGRSVVLGLQPGPVAEAVRSLVQADFERDHRLRLIVEQAEAPELLDRLRSDRSEVPANRLLVLGLDQSTASLAWQEGLVARLNRGGIPNLDDVHPEYILKADYGVGLGVSWVTAWYNIEKVKDPPTTCEAFWDPWFRGRVALPSIGTTAGVEWLVLVSALATGKPYFEAQYEVDPGYQKWRQLQPSLHSTYQSFEQVAPLLAQGEVWMSFGPSQHAAALMLKGAPIERAPVQEGPFLGLHALVLQRHPILEPVGRDLINRLLEPEVQSELARRTAFGPVNRRAVVPPEFERVMPVGAEEARNMRQLDWAYISRSHAVWAEQWGPELSS